jgi:hypothetical protein
MPRLLRVPCAFATLLIVCALPATALGGAASTRVFGGTPGTAESTPWHVAILMGPALCGGSVLDATHVLTAAQCAADEGGAVRPASAFTVLAGFSDISRWSPGAAAPAGTQVTGVASLRIHPNYDAAAKSDDVMVLTLTTALDLRSPAVRPIALAPAGTAVPPGTPLQTQGFGQSSPSAPRPDGLLRAVPLTALSDDACRANQAGTSGVVLCAQGPGGSGPCHGDSGGALTTTAAPPMLVGVVSYSGFPDCGTGQDAYVEVSAPEVRAFLDGLPQIPLAPRLTAPPSIRSVLPAVQGSPLSCTPGAWTGAPTLNYIFRDDLGAERQSGPWPVYVPGPDAVGRAITCLVEATDAGGTSTARTATTPPLQPDAVAPVARLRRLRCTHRTCRAEVLAADPNSRGALRVRAWAHYRVGHRTRSRVAAGRPVGAGRFAVTLAKLPVGRVALTFRAYDAAGNPQRRPLQRTVRIRRQG